MQHSRLNMHMTINSNTTLAKTNISDEQNCGSQYLYASDFFFFLEKVHKRIPQYMISHSNKKMAMFKKQD